MVGKGRLAKLLCVGDSIIDGVGASTIETGIVGQLAAVWAETGRRVTYQSIGRTGAKSANIIEELLPNLRTGEIEAADLVVVSAGVNDITGLVRTDSWQRNIIRIIGELKEHSPEAVIVFLGIPPLWRFPLVPEPLRSVIGIRAKIFDTMLRSVIDDHQGVVHIPLQFDARPGQFSKDGYHPNEKSYTMIAQIVIQTIDIQ